MYTYNKYITQIIHFQSYLELKKNLKKIWSFWLQMGIWAQNLHRDHLLYGCNRFVWERTWFWLMYCHFRPQNRRHGNNSISQVLPGSTEMQRIAHQRSIAATSQAWCPTHEHAHYWMLVVQISCRLARDAIWNISCMSLLGMGTQLPHQPQTTIFVVDMPRYWICIQWKHASKLHEYKLQSLSK